MVTGTNGLSTTCGTQPPNSLTGEMALISRGDCSFSEKIRNAQVAGALGVIVANNVAGDPTAMASDGTADQPIVPAVMVGLEDGLALQLLAGKQATLGSTPDYQRTTNDNIMAGFSSRTDGRRLPVKPGMVAPGVNVLSSIPGGDWAFYSGTSMAAPHLAGMAAVIRGAHPTLSAEQVRSVIVNTATQGTLDYGKGTVIVTDVNVVGAGLANLQAAVDARLSLGPVSTSFGAVPSGSGKSLIELVRVTNVSGDPLTDLNVSIDDGTLFSVDPDLESLETGESADVAVSIACPRARQPEATPRS